MDTQNLVFIVKLSRPRFWFYLAGTFWVGTIIGITSLEKINLIWILILFLYFLIPANIYLYGINDYFDQDTDSFNNKKLKQEIRIDNQKKLLLLKILLLFTTILTLLLVILVPYIEIKFLLIIFFLLSTFYSAPPLRFKKRPFIDFSSNILYGLPGIIGYFLITQNLPPWPILIALYFWTSAMHLFSAIPDINADRKVNIITTAVFLGEKNSHILCFIFWLLSAFIPLIFTSAFIINYLLFIYPALILCIWIWKLNISKVYWWFPYISGTIGFVSYWYFFIKNIL